MEIPADRLKDLQLWFYHDDDAEVYINGVLALNAPGWTPAYDTFPMSEPGKTALKPGKNLVAIHCHQIRGGQNVDLGFVNVQSE